MASDVVKRLLPLPRHVCQFTQLRVFVHFSRAVRRMMPAGSEVPGVAVVTQVELEAEIVAKGNESMEDAVISDEPWRDDEKRRQRCARCHRSPIQKALAVTETSPSAQERHDRKHDRVGQGCNAT